MLRATSLVLLITACSSSPSGTDARPPDASAERAPDGLPSVDGRVDLRPDGPRPPAIWKTVPGASLVMQGHTVTLLQNGEALIVGGYTQAEGVVGYTYLRKTYRYLPASDTIVEAGELASPRAEHDAVRLSDGRVLVVGGTTETTFFPTATEIFDPKQPPATAWSPGPSLFSGRRGASAVLLANGQVMLSGGEEDTIHDSVDSILLFTPGSSAWEFGLAPLKRKRRYHASTLLEGGAVLLSGGAHGSYADPTYLSSLEAYDAKNGTSTLLPVSMARPRAFHSATLLDDGRVFIVGGYCGSCSGSVDDLLDPKTDAISPISHPVDTTIHLAAKLLDGRVLITSNGQGAENLVIAFNPIASPPRWDTLPQMPHPRDRGKGVTLADGSVLVVGGVAAQGPFTYAPEVERLLP